ncbi:MAG TPA: sigma-70 family RNA polymerase sigma factor [bacterium]|nr:sigma-70 family RNA polymerase sigma factor [bacterium]
MEKEMQFKEMLDTNKDRIYRICCCYVRERHTREDVFQTVLLNLWEGLDGFQGRSQMNTWVYRVTVNTCLGYLRAGQSRQKLLQKAAQESASDCMNSEDVPCDQPTDQQDDVGRLLDCINLLQPTDRMLISMYMEDASANEIAEVLGISPVNARVKLHRIKRTLKDMVERRSHGYRSDEK